MFIEEKIEALKKQLSDKDLKIRFTEFKAIMEKIESHFLDFSDLNYKYSGWEKRLVGFEDKPYDNSVEELLNELLLDDKNYWWIYVEPPSYPNSRHRIFDASLKGGKSLANLFYGSPIFIVDKKYFWMIAIDRKKKILRKRTANNA